MAAITNDWLGPLSAEFKKPYYRRLYDTVKHEYETRRIFPDPDDIFNAFSFTLYDTVLYRKKGIYLLQLKIIPNFTF